MITITAVVTNDAAVGSPSWGSGKVLDSGVVTPLPQPFQYQRADPPGSGAGASEIPQLYVTVPRQPAPLPVPKFALQGFTKVQLQPRQSAAVAFHLVPGQYCTTREDGHCEVFAGEYTVSVGGKKTRDLP